VCARTSQPCVAPWCSFLCFTRVVVVVVIISSFRCRRCCRVVFTSPRVIVAVPAACLLDVGAGDGGVTSRLAPFFSTVVCTEVSTQMCRRLRQRGYRCGGCARVVPHGTAFGTPPLGLPCRSCRVVESGSIGPSLFPTRHCFDVVR
jgi:hypothetical protein